MWNSIIIIQNKNQNYGFVLIEALVGVVIASLLSTAFLSSIYQASVVNSHTRDHLTASLAILEIYEVATALSYSDFNTISNTTCSTASPCHITHDGSTWSIVSGTQVFNDRFERSFVLSNVYRDGSFNITTTGGTLDVDTMALEILVNWENRGNTFNEEITTYLHRINP